MKCFNCGLKDASIELSDGNQYCDSCENDAKQILLGKMMYKVVRTNRKSLFARGKYEHHYVLNRPVAAVESCGIFGYRYLRDANRLISKTNRGIVLKVELISDPFRPNRISTYCGEADIKAFYDTLDDPKYWCLPDPNHVYCMEVRAIT